MLTQVPIWRIPSTNHSPSSISRIRYTTLHIQWGAQDIYYLLMRTFQFVSLTADNASNNGTLVKSLTKFIHDANIEVDVIDPKNVIIHCLAHVLHLCVMELMVALKSLSKTKVEKNEATDLAVEINETVAEVMAGDNEYAGMEDEEIINYDHQLEGRGSLSSIIQRVCQLCLFVCAEDYAEHC